MRKEQSGAPGSVPELVVAVQKMVIRFQEQKCSQIAPLHPNGQRSDRDAHAPENTSPQEVRLKSGLLDIWPGPRLLARCAHLGHTRSNFGPPMDWLNGLPDHGLWVRMAAHKPNLTFTH